jgi:hypothetical protein
MADVTAQDIENLYPGIDPDTAAFYAALENGETEGDLVELPAE